MGIHAAADAIWKKSLERLSASITKDDLDTWIKPLQPEQRGDTFLLYAPNAFVREAVEGQYRDAIHATFPDGTNVRLVIGSRPKATPSDAASASQPAPAPSPAPTISAASQSESPAGNGSTLEPSTGVATKPRRARQTREVSSEPGHLPFIWGDATRAIPNEFVRSGLFTINRYGEGVARPRRDKALIASQRNFFMYVTGDETNIFDRDVLMQLLQYQRKYKVGQRFSFSARQVLEDLGKPPNGRDIAALIQSIERLHHTHVRLEQIDGTRGRFGNFTLVGEFYRDESEGAGRQNWVVSFNEVVADLLGQNEHTRLLWSQSQRLKLPLAKWLHGYFGSHQRPHPVTTEFLHKMTGSNISARRNFRIQIKDALAELVQAGFLLTWSYDQPSDKWAVTRAPIDPELYLQDAE